MLKQISQYLPEIKDRYYISDSGDLYTDYGQRKLNNCLQYKGYVRNCLKLKNNKEFNGFRHRLVMICFNYREDYKEMQVNHKNGNKQDNRLENLEWCTNQENRIHAVQTGLAEGLKGETNPSHKLTEEQVKEIISHILQKDLSYNQLAKKYHCSKSTIAAIKAKRNWTYLTKDIDFN